MTKLSKVTPTTSVDIPITDPSIGYVDYSTIPSISKYEGVDISKYSTYLTRGTFLNQNYNAQRGASQSTGQQLGRSLQNLIPNIALGIIENVGYLGALVTEFGDDRDYSNFLTKFAQKGHNIFGEVYREDDDVISMGDPAWWFNNGFGLVESMAEFLITGYGVGGFLSKGAKLLSRGILNQLGNTYKALKTGVKIQQGTRAIARVATAFDLAYVEGAMSATQVYKDIYAKTGDKHLAANSAARTARANTAIVGLLNLTGIGAIFPKGKAFTSLSKLGLQRKAGESTTKFASRLSNYKYTGIKKKGRNILIREAVQEGVEEDVNLVAEQMGYNLGEGVTGDEARKKISERVFSDEGALNFVLGALGGLGQTAGLSRIAMYKSPEGGRESANTRETRLEQEATDSYVEGVTKDFKRIVEIQDKLKKELAKEKPNEQKLLNLKMQLFNPAASYAIRNGAGEALKQTYKELAEMDNSKMLSDDIQLEIDELNKKLKDTEQVEPNSEEQIKILSQDISVINKEISKLNEDKKKVAGKTKAMELGLALDIDDNEYSELANSFIDMIDDLTTTYEDIMTNFSYNMDEDLSGLGNYIFDTYLELTSTNKIINYLQDKVNILKSDINFENNPNKQIRVLLEEQYIKEIKEDRDKLSKKYKDLVKPKFRKEFVKQWKKDKDELKKQRKEYINDLVNKIDSISELEELKKSNSDSVAVIDKRITKLKKDKETVDKLKADKEARDKGKADVKDTANNTVKDTVPDDTANNTVKDTVPDDIDDIDDTKLRTTNLESEDRDVISIINRLTALTKDRLVESLNKKFKDDPTDFKKRLKLIAETNDKEKGNTPSNIYEKILLSIQNLVKDGRNPSNAEIKEILDDLDMIDTTDKMNVSMVITLYMTLIGELSHVYLLLRSKDTNTSSDIDTSLASPVVNPVDNLSVYLYDLHEIAKDIENGIIKVADNVITRIKALFDSKVGDEVIVRIDKTINDERFEDESYKDNVDTVPIVIERNGVRIGFININNNTIHNHINYGDNETNWFDILLQDDSSLTTLVDNLDDFNRILDNKKVNNKELTELLNKLVHSNQDNVDLSPENFNEAIKHLANVIYYNTSGRPSTITPDILIKNLTRWQNRILADIRYTTSIRSAINGDENKQLKLKIVKKSTPDVLFTPTQDTDLLTNRLKEGSEIRLVYSDSKDDSSVLYTEDGETTEDSNIETAYKVRKAGRTHVLVDGENDTVMVVPIMAGKVSQKATSTDYNSKLTTHVSKIITKLLDALRDASVTISDNGDKSIDTTKIDKIFDELESIVVLENGKNKEGDSNNIINPTYDIKHRSIEFQVWDIDGRMHQVRLKANSSSTRVTLKVDNNKAIRYSDDIFTAGIRKIIGYMKRSSKYKNNILDAPGINIVEDGYRDPVTKKIYKGKTIVEAYKKYLLETGALVTNIGYIEDSKGKRISNINPKGKRPLTILLESPSSEPKVKPKVKSEVEPPVQPLDVLLAKHELTKLFKKYSSLLDILDNPRFREATVEEELEFIKLAGKLPYAAFKDGIVIITSSFDSVDTKSKKLLILHELIHKVLRENLSKEQYTDLQEKLNQFVISLLDTKEVKDLKAKTKPSVKESSILRILQLIEDNNEELVTYGFSNTNFVTFLSSIKSNTATTESTTFWNDLKELIADIYKAITGNKLDELNNILDTIFEESKESTDAKNRVIPKIQEKDNTEVSTSESTITKPDIIEDNTVKIEQKKQELKDVRDKKVKEVNDEITTVKEELSGLKQEQLAEIDAKIEADKVAKELEQSKEDAIKKEQIKVEAERKAKAKLEEEKKAVAKKLANEKKNKEQLKKKEQKQKKQREKIQKKYDKLSDANKKILEKDKTKHNDNREIVDYILDKITQFINNLIPSSDAIYNIIKSITKTMLGLSLIFSPIMVVQSETTINPTVTEINIEDATFAFHPKDLMLYANLGDSAKAIYAKMQSENTAYIIAEKETGSIHLIDSTNKLIKTLPALYGRVSGESQNNYFSKDANGNTIRNQKGATSPEGTYILNTNINEKTNSLYEGNVFNLYHEDGTPAVGEHGGIQALHQTYLGDLSKREAALNSLTIEDNKQSGGCININKDNFEKYVTPNYDKGTFLFITPDIKFATETEDVSNINDRITKLENRIIFLNNQIEAINKEYNTAISNLDSQVNKSKDINSNNIQEEDTHDFAIYSESPQRNEAKKLASLYNIQLNGFSITTFADEHRIRRLAKEIGLGFKQAKSGKWYFTKNGRFYNAFANEYATESETVNTNVDYALNVISGLEKINRNVFKKEKIQGWINDLKKQQQGITDQQIELFKDAAKDGMTKGEIIASILADYSYVVEINIATDSSDSDIDGTFITVKGESFKPHGIHGWVNEYDNTPATKEELLLIENELLEGTQTPTQLYNDYTVEGGINYKEKAIKLKGVQLKKGQEGNYHERDFNNNEGDMLAWVRSDEQVNIEKNINNIPIEFEGSTRNEGGIFKQGTVRKVDNKWTINNQIITEQDVLILYNTENGNSTKTIRIQEIQSRLQKHRGEDILTTTSKEANTFVKLLEKDNNWITFVVKSIVQDSAKKEYTKVLFPTGKTAAKVEEHETLADEIEKIDTLIEQGGYIAVIFTRNEDGSRYKKVFETEDQLRAWAENTHEDYSTPIHEADNIEMLRQRRNDLKTQGIEKLKPIENFYENTIKNILNKTYGKTNIKSITDEHDSTWLELSIVKERDLNTINFATETESNPNNSNIPIKLTTAGFTNLEINHFNKVLSGAAIKIEDRIGKETIGDIRDDVSIKTVKGEVLKNLKYILNHYPLTTKQKEVLGKLFNNLLKYNSEVWDKFKKYYNTNYNIQINDVSDFVDENNNQIAGVPTNWDSREQFSSNLKNTIPAKIRQLVGRTLKLKPTTKLAKPINIPDIILPIGTSGSGKSTWITSINKDNKYVVISLDELRIEVTGDINDKSKDKEVYKKATDKVIKAVQQGKSVIYDTTNLTKDKRLLFIEAIKKVLPNANIQYKLMELNPKLAKQRIKAQIKKGESRANVSDITIDRHADSYKQMLIDIENEPISNFDENTTKLTRPEGIPLKQWVSENADRGTLTGLSEPIDFNKIWNYLWSIQASATTPTEMLNILEDAAIYTDPSLYPMYELLNEDIDLRNSWFTVFKLQTPERVTILHKPSGKNVTVLQQISNRKSYPHYVLVDDWTDNILRNINNNKFKKELASDFNIKLTNDKKKVINFNDTAVQISAYSIRIGLNISVGTIKSLLAKNNNSYNKLQTEILIPLQLLTKFINKHKTEGTDTFDEHSNLLKLAKATSKYEYVNNIGNVTNVKNKAVYTPHLPSYISDWFDMLKDTKTATEYLLSLTRIPKLKYSNWLYNTGTTKTPNGFIDNNSDEDITENNIKINKTFINNLKYKLLDGNKNIFSQTSEDYVDMLGDNWHLNNIIHYIFGNLPLPSVGDSNHTNLITIPKIELKEDDYKNNKVSRDSKAYKAVYNTYLQELFEMISARNALLDIKDGVVTVKLEYRKPTVFEKQEYKDNKLTKEEFDKIGSKIHLLQLHKDWNGVSVLNSAGKPTGNVFTFMNMDVNIDDKTVTLSEYLDSKEDSLLYNGVLHPDTEQTISKNKLVKEFIDLFIQQQISNNIKVFDTLKYSIGKLTNVKGTQLVSNFNKLIAEFTINDYINSVETAEYWNGSINEYEDIISINKRINELIKPGVTTGDIEGQFNQLKIQDIILQSNIHDEVKKILGDKYEESEFNDINTGDGFTVITLEEFAKRTEGYGRTKELNDIIEKARGGESITPMEYSNLIQSQKYFRYSRRSDNSSPYPRQKSIQDKNSTMILIPSMHTNTEMGTLLEIMNTNNIQEIIFESANKTGGTPALQLHNTKTGRLLKTIPNKTSIANHTRNVYRKDLRIQQDYKQHLVDELNKLGIQIAKKIFDNLDWHNEIYELDGIKLTGSELFDKFANILTANIKESSYTLIEELGGTIVNGEIVKDKHGNIPIDLTKVKEYLMEYLEEYSTDDNIKEALKVNLPLYSSITVTKFISVLNALFTNRIINQKQPGSHLALLPDIFRNPNSKNKIDSVNYTDDFINEVEKGNRDYKLKSELVKDGKVTVAEVVMPADSRHFFDENGMLFDINTLSPELLESIGYFIPTQGKQSTIVFKVVGFMKNGASQIILPSDMVARSGIDFDIDAMYTIVYNIENHKGKLRKVPYDPSDIDNNYVNYVFKKVYDSLEQEDKDAIDEYQKQNKKIIVDDYNDDIEIAKEDKESQRNIVKDKTKNVDIDESAFSKLPLEIKEEYWSYEVLLANKTPLEKMVAYHVYTYYKLKSATGNIKIIYTQMMQEYTKVIKNILVNKKEFDKIYELFISTTKDIEENTLDKLAESWDIVNNKIAIQLANTTEGVLSKDEFSKLPKEEQVSKRARENRITDIFNSILKNIQHYDELNKPNTFSHTAEAGREVNELLGLLNKILNHNKYLDRVELRDMNLSVGTLKGQSLALSAIVAVLSKTNAYLRDDLAFRIKYNTEELKNVSKNTLIKVLGKENVQSIKDGYILTFKYIGNNANNTSTDIYGNKITNQTSEITANILDAITNPMGHNLNEYTFSVYALFSNLGVIHIDSEGNNNAHIYASMFINQPVLLNYTTRMKNNKGITGNNMSKATIFENTHRDYLTKLYKKLRSTGNTIASFEKALKNNKDVMLDNSNKLNGNYEEVVAFFNSILKKYNIEFKPYEAVPVTLDELRDNIKQLKKGLNNTSVATSIKYYATQLNILYLFMNNDDAAGGIITAIGALNTDKIQLGGNAGFANADKLINNIRDLTVDISYLKKKLKEDGIHIEVIDEIIEKIHNAAINDIAKIVGSDVAYSKILIKDRPVTEMIYSTLFKTNQNSEYRPLDSYYQYGVEPSTSALKPLFIQYTPIYEHFTDDIVRDLFINSNTITNIKNYLTYILTKDLAYFNRGDDAATQLQKESILGINIKPLSSIVLPSIAEFKKLPLANQIYLIKENYTDYINSFDGYHILEILQIKDKASDIKANGYIRLDFNYTGDTNPVVDSFKHIYYNEVEYIRIVAQNLIKYAFYTNGLTFGYNYTKVIPAYILANEVGYGKLLHSKLIEMQNLDNLSIYSNGTNEKNLYKANWKNRELIPIGKPTFKTQFIEHTGTTVNLPDNRFPIFKQEDKYSNIIIESIDKINSSTKYNNKKAILIKKGKVETLYWRFDGHVQTLNDGTKTGYVIYYPINRTMTYEYGNTVLDKYKVDKNETEYKQEAEQYIYDTFGYNNITRSKKEYEVIDNKKDNKVLSNKTKQGNIVIKSVYQREGVEYAKSIGGIFSMRLNYTNKHFGNPFTDGNKTGKGIVKSFTTISEAAEAYKDWLTTDKYNNIQGLQERKKWILEQIESGKLKGKPIVYYKELNELSHANMLDGLINDTLNDIRQPTKRVQGSLFDTVKDNKVLSTTTQYGITFTELADTKYSTKTKEVINNSDTTISIITKPDAATKIIKNFATMRSNELYKSNTVGYLEINTAKYVELDTLVNVIVNHLNNINKDKLNINITGSDILNLNSKQSIIDNTIYKLLNKVLNNSKLSKDISIINAGQSGIDEAVAKSASKLGYNVTVIMNKGLKYRNVEGTDIYIDPTKSKDRFDNTTISFATESESDIANETTAEKTANHFLSEASRRKATIDYIQQSITNFDKMHNIVYKHIGGVYKEKLSETISELSDVTWQDLNKYNNLKIHKALLSIQSFAEYNLANLTKRLDSFKSENFIEVGKDKERSKQVSTTLLHIDNFLQMYTDINTLSDFYEGDKLTEEQQNVNEDIQNLKQLQTNIDKLNIEAKSITKQYYLGRVLASTTNPKFKNVNTIDKWENVDDELKNIVMLYTDNEDITNTMLWLDSAFSNGVTFVDTLLLRYTTAINSAKIEIFNKKAEFFDLLVDVFPEALRGTIGTKSKIKLKHLSKIEQWFKDTFIEHEDGKATGRLITKYKMNKYLEAKTKMWEEYHRLKDASNQARRNKQKDKAKEFTKQASALLKDWNSKHSREEVIKYTKNPTTYQQKEDNKFLKDIEEKEKILSESAFKRYSKFKFIRSDNANNWYREVPRSKYLNPQYNKIHNVDVNGKALNKETKFYQYLIKSIPEMMEFNETFIAEVGYYPNMPDIERSTVDSIKQYFGAWEQNKSTQTVGLNNELINVLRFPMFSRGVGAGIFKIAKKLSVETTEEYEKRALSKLKDDTGVDFNTIAEAREEREKRIEEQKSSLDSDVSYNIFNVMNAYIHKTTEYKHKKDFEAELLLGVKQVGNELTFITRRKGTNDTIENTLASIFKGKKEVHQIKGADSNTYRKLKYFVDRMFYEQPVDANRTIKYIVRAGMQITSMKVMMANVTAGVKNVTKGTLDMIMDGVSNEFTTLADLRWASARYLAKIPKDILANAGSPRSNDIATAIIKKYANDLVEMQDEISESFSHEVKNKMDKVFMYSNSLYFTNNAPEHFMQISMYLAMLKSHRAINGKITSYNEYKGDVREGIIKEIFKDNPILIKEMEDYIKTQESIEKYKFNKHDYLGDWFRDKIFQLGTKEGKLLLQEFSKKNKEINKELKAKFEEYETAFDQFELDIVDSAQGTGYANIKEHSKVTEDEISLFKEKVRNVNHDMHGIYNKIDKNYLQGLIWGEPITQFRKWMKPNWNRYFGARFGKAIYNERKRTWSKGAYASWWQYMTTPIKHRLGGNVTTNVSTDELTTIRMFKQLIKDYTMFISNMNMFKDSLDSTEIANIRRTNQNMLSIIILGAIVFALGGVAKKSGDDDDEDIMLKLALYEANMIYMEVTEFVPIVGWYGVAQRFMQYPFASQKTAEDILKLLWTTFNYPLWDDEKRKYQGGVHYKQDKLLSQLKKNTPVLREFYKWQNIPAYTNYYRMYNPFYFTR